VRLLFPVIDDLGVINMKNFDEPFLSFTYYTLRKQNKPYNTAVPREIKSTGRWGVLARTKKTKRK
jgi:hypothetical protein